MLHFRGVDDGVPMVDDEDSDVVVASIPVASTPQRRPLPRHGRLNEIRKTNSNLVVIEKTTTGNDKEDYDIDADDDDADNAEESEGEEFEQETG